MPTAKLFMIGKSQAIRLLKASRFQGAEDQDTVEVVLSAKQNSWEAFFKLADSAAIPANFMEVREDLPAQERNVF